jgi:hypothetical protein
MILLVAMFVVSLLFIREPKMKLKNVAFVLVGCCFFGLLTISASLQAAPPADPYADAVEDFQDINDPENAIGAPDGTGVSFSGAADSIMLDMGEGEEGTGDLDIHYQAVSVGLLITVDFLDEQKNLIVSQSALLPPSVQPASTTVTYDPSPSPAYTPYRFVEIVGTVTNFELDAVEAATYWPDSDNDGLPDSWEVENGLDPLDNSGDNGADGDPDNDNLTNSQEYANGTDPQDEDSDGDLLPDGWEVDNGLDPNDDSGDNGANSDPDEDGLSNIEELANGTDPQDEDSDEDTLPDGWEVDNGLDPNDNSGDNGADGDPDEDGVPNDEELINGTYPIDDDSDDDGLLDGWEIDNGLDPNDDSGDNGADGDPDEDGLTNEQEAAIGTDPNDNDTDGDGFLDGWEIDNYCNPLDSSDPLSHALYLPVVIR